MKNNTSKIGYLIVGLLLLNYVGTHFYKRFDLTNDKRYTLSESSLKIINEVKEPILIKVYLEGDFPAEFKRLQIETKLHLEELKSKNKQIRYQFINPTDIEESLIEKGIEPSNLQIQEDGKISELVIFPWAEVIYKDKTEFIPLLKDVFSKTQEEQLTSSIQSLEYSFSNAIHKITSLKSKKIAVLRGNGQLSDIYVADFLRKLGEYYYLAPFTLDSVATNPQKTLNELSNFDLVICAKPTQKFSEEEKYTLDQYTMRGGKSLWLIDNIQAELDSLMDTGETLAYPRELNLTDLFFNYGIRINSNLVRDLYATSIPLATGNVGNQTQFNTFLWSYFPLIVSKNNHPINNNIEAVSLKFTSTIDTLTNEISKTILLKSSPLSKPVGTPSIVSLKSITEEQDPASFANGNQNVGVLLEGNFKSAYEGRIKPFKIEQNKDKSISTQLIVIADGDIIANAISKGVPLPLGIDKWTNQQYGNKDFLLNSVNYLLDDNGLINIRSKTVKINFLDKEKTYQQAFKWQAINILVPLLILVVFGVLFTFIKKKKYQ
ncbi:gliding motility-associated ABC transporter substrate-binding protein GldG [Lutibacter sp.]|uniref:gliding motility-associated ABC transporter substrate-binding protein GldG n=1 Tax=Lutibacter sp. TaxID=1925666 RepID=UPI002735E26C|nr:gliding motility-associated ABC transporter substrate-binding protein GldG [Lutibacter sp.]MDP3314053.1 gliding motility-associated ABC transporter substrate-binding protein GldG [Lutibacter sp.]